MADYLRPITDFIPWLPNAACAAELQVIRAVTGHDDLPVDGFSHPADGSDFAHVVSLVETHRLQNLLCVIADLGQPWWRVVANWDRLVGHLDRANPHWRDGAKVDPSALDAALDALYSPGPIRRRIGIVVDGTLADHDALIWDLADDGGWTFDIDAPGDQTHPSLIDHVPEHQRAALAAAVRSDGWCRSLPVVPGAQEGVQALLAAGHEVVAVTRTSTVPAGRADERAEWLDEHFPTLDTFVLTSDLSVGFSAPDDGILLDRTIDIVEAASASWSPILAAAPFNGPTTRWGRSPRWGWADPVERLSW